MYLTVGKPITEELSDYLKEFTSNNDRANATIKANSCGTSTLRDVVLRNNSVSENSMKALEELISIAKLNAQSRIDKAQLALVIFDNILIDSSVE